MIMNNSKSLERSFLSGCVSGIVCTVAFQPFEVIKTNIQANMLFGKPYVGLASIVKKIVSVNSEKTVRIQNLWTGTCPALCRQGPGIGGYFLSVSILEPYFNNLTQAFGRHWISDSTVSFLVGFTARSLMVLMFNPFQVVKTQMESDIAHGQSMICCFKRIYIVNKWKGLFSGTMASIVRDSPYSGLYLMIYSRLRYFVTSSSPFQTNANSSPFLVVSCAAITSLVATGLTQPADVLRAYRQLAICSNSKRRLSLVNVFQQIYTTHGVFGFWRGLSMRLLRRMIVSTVSWSLYEFLA